MAYSLSKLLNILYTRELARRSAGTGVTANCLHPGFVATRFGDAERRPLLLRGPRVQEGVRASRSRRAPRPSSYLASSPEMATISGGYFYQCQLAAPTRAAQDDAMARRLWTETGATRRALRLTSRGRGRARLLAAPAGGGEGG